MEPVLQCLVGAAPGALQKGRSSLDPVPCGCVGAVAAQAARLCWVTGFTNAWSHHRSPLPWDLCNTEISEAIVMWKAEQIQPQKYNSAQQNLPLGIPLGPHCK